MRNKFNSTNDLLLWAVFYSIAHGGLLFISNAVYWDDWVYYRADPGTIYDISRQIGWMFGLFGYMHVALLEVGPWIYKVLTFFLMFASGLVLGEILKRYAAITRDGRFFIVLLFLLLPFNSARVALVDFHYTLCYFLFFAAWLLMDRFRVVALALFFLSFNTNSLLVFYVVPVLDMFYRGGHLSSLKAAMLFCLHRIDYMLLPFVYFFIKTIAYSPSGVYQGYNEGYKIGNIPHSIVVQVGDLFSTDVNIGLGLCFSLIAFLLIHKKSLVAVNSKQNQWLLPVVGIALFFLGAFPYWVLGLVPTFHEWSSRHQLLLPLGSALVIVGAFAYSNSSGKLGVMSIMIGASLAFNVSTYASLFIDWQKQRQIIYLFKKNTSIERAGLIVVDDRMEQLNALKRKYRFYEWSGIAEAAFGDQRRLAIPRSQLDDYLSGKFNMNLLAPFKAKSFKRDSSAPAVLVEIDSINPGGDRVINVDRLFPEFVLSVSAIDLGISE